MNLDFWNNLGNSIKENKMIQSFMKEIGDYLENKATSKSEVADTLDTQRKASIISRNTIRNKKAELLKKSEGKITEELKEEISKITNEVLDKQDKELKEFRKEDHLYMVEEDREGRIYLTDITDKSNNIVLEEVDFPKDLLNQATEGTIFQYKNEEYHFYSRSGFDI